MNFSIGKDVLPHEYKGTVYNKDSANRLRWIGRIFFVCFAVFIFRTFQLSLQENEYVKYVVSNTDIERRADIVDRNGVLLASSVMSGNLKFYPNKVDKKYKDEVAGLIHEINPFNYSVKDALNLINAKKSGVYIKYNLDKETIEYIQEKNKKYDCFQLETFFVRRYPQHNVFSHVIGFAGRDIKNKKEDTYGKMGVELNYDKYLRENKEPLKLSLDARVQNIFHEQLSIAMDKYKAKSAMGMLMNMTTGEMIAMVQVPDFDPNNIKNASNLKFNLLRTDYEMGSVFKIFNTALAYENGLQDRIYEVDKPYMIYDIHGHKAMSKPIEDVRSFYRDIKEGKIPAKMSANDIMKYSCNVGSAKIALDLPQDAQKDMFNRLHLNQPLDLDFGKTEWPIIHADNKWGKVEKATAAFGHGIKVTPMHLLLGVNAVTNGGYYMYPTLLKRDIGPVKVERVLDSEISAKIRDIMFSIAEETTARNARVPGIKIGGKTGTAEKRINGVVDKSKNVTVFAGVFPIDVPQYIILVLLDEPQKVQESSNQRTAAYNAVPTAGAILNAIMPLLFE